MKVKKIIFQFMLLVFMLIGIEAAAIEKPEIFYDGVSRIEISGVLDKKYAGRFVSLKLDGGSNNLGYIGQTAVRPDGTYSHSFQFTKKITDYKLSVNLAGMRINESVVSALATPERVSVDLRLTQNYNLASVRAEIEDYFGIYTGSGVEYVIAFACYDEKGKLLGVNIGNQGKTDFLNAAIENMEEVIPSDAVVCKAFVWGNVKTMLPLSGAAELQVSETGRFDTYNAREEEWQSINMRDSAMLGSGLAGGEGGQRIMSIAVSRDDTLMLCGNDTGGINRSVDGGKTWEDCLRGFLPGGATAIAVDPCNKNRVLAAGATQTGNISRVSGASEAVRNITGLYLSEDAGFSWRQVLKQPGAVTFFDFREAISYDEATYDPQTGGCTTAYWSRPWRLQASGGAPVNADDVYATELDQKGLWKTTDGGENWFCVNAEMSDGYVKVHPTDGTVYVANLDGFHRSTDGGATFETVMSGRIFYGLDVVYTKGYEDWVWINDHNGVWRSEDCGASFTLISDSSFPQSADPENPDQLVRQLKVSPVNPDFVVLGYYNGVNYSNRRYYSRNGGRTWNVASYDEKLDFFKVNNRHPVFVWSNTNAYKVWSTGGDWITSSSNGGQSYIWNYNGGGEVFVDQRTIFNIYNPDILYYGSQDFHGALTTDGGKTWKHIWRFTNQYAGYVYGSYAADENTLIAIVAEGSQSAKRSIYVSRDAGETWENSGCAVTGRGLCKWAEQCYQSPRNPQILFAADWRSTDYGYTWEKMCGVHAVNTHNPYGDKELYGSYYDKIVVSYDDGLTWAVYAEAVTDETANNTQIWDITYDGIGNTLYYVSGNAGSGKHFCKIQNGITTELTQNLNRHPELGVSFQLCAVDPNYPDIVYVGGYSNRYLNPNGVQRSTDGGMTFQTLTTSGADNSIVRSGIAGGIEPYDLIVHPVSGELWAPQGCNGWAKFPPPYFMENK